MLVFHWLNRFVTYCRSHGLSRLSGGAVWRPATAQEGSFWRPVVVRTPQRERLLKLMRLEQRRVLNADFSFVAHANLTLSHVDGDLAVREVGSHFEFDLTGSVWDHVGGNGAFSIDNSVANRSILSIDRSEFGELHAGLSISADPNGAHRLTLETQNGAIDLQMVTGLLAVSDFEDVHQVGQHDLLVNDFTITARDSIELQHLRGEDLALSAAEIDFNGGSHSIVGSSLSVVTGTDSAIELGGSVDQANVLDFTSADLGALSGGFHSISFSAQGGHLSGSIAVLSSGADVRDALSSAGQESETQIGDLYLSADTVHIDGELTSSGGLIDVRATQAVTVSQNGGLVSHGGEIVVDAGVSGTLLVSGRVDVSSVDLQEVDPHGMVARNGIGGSIHLLGERVGLFGGARVDASGDNGGGEVLIGGDLRGDNAAIPHALRAYVGSDVEINADAIEHGHGGKVVVWSDEVSQVYGLLTARGGALFGNGGLIETSSHGQLLLSGGGDASAANGNAGTWLLDPLNVGIVHQLTLFPTIIEFNELPDFAPSVSGSEVTDDAIETQLNNGTNVVLSTANTTGGEAGNVTQLADATINVLFTAPGNSATLTINAANNIVLDGGITAANGTLNVVLNANTVPDDPDRSAGNIKINAAITTNGGSFFSSGVNFESTDGAITATGGVTILQTGTTALGAINSGDGSLAVVSGGNITDSGSVIVGGNASFTTSQANADINLDLLQVTGTLAVNTIGANGDATIMSSTGIDFAAGSVEGNLTATTSSGDITDSGVLIVGHNAQFTTDRINDGIDLNLLQLTGTLALNTSGSNGDASVVNATGIDFAATNVGGMLTATATTGNITDSSSVIVGGYASFITSQANHEIDLSLLQLRGTLALNTVGANGNATVINATDVDFAATNVEGNLSVTASAGNITDIAALNVGGNAHFSTNAGGNITIAAPSSVNFGTLTFVSTGTVSIVEDSTTVLSGFSTAQSLSLSSTDAITNDGTSNVSIDNNATFNGTNITLGNQIGNSLNFGTLTFVSTGAVSITEESDIVLSGVSSAASLSLNSSGTITNDGTAGVSIASNASFSSVSITLDDVFQFGSLTFSSEGAVVIYEADASVLSGISTASSLNLVSGDSITNDGSANVSIDNNATFDGTKITLGDQVGNTMNFGTLTFVSTGAVSIAEDSGTVLSGTSAAFSLNLSSGDLITNDGSANISIDNNAMFSASLTTLGDQVGDILNFGTLTFVSAGDVNIAEDSTTVLRGTSTASSLNLHSDAISDDGTANVAIDGNASFHGTNVTLSDIYEFGSLTFTSDGEVSIKEADATVLSGASNALSLNLSGSDMITNDGTAHIAINGNATFDGASITLGDQAGDSMNFGTLTLVSTGDVRVIQDSDIVLSGSNTVFNLNLTSIDTITNDGSANVTIIDNATFQGTSITLGDQSGDSMSFGSLTFISGGAVRIEADSVAVLSGISSASSLNLSSDDSISDDGTGNVSIDGNATYNASSITLYDTYQFGSLTFNSSGLVNITEAHATVLSGTSTAGSLILASADSITNDGSADVSVDTNAAFSATSILLDDSYHFGSLTFTSAGAVSVTEADNIVLSGDSTALSLGLFSTSSITEEVGATLSVAETANFVGFSSSVILDQANDFGGTVTLSSGDASTLNDINSVTLGDSSVNGLFTVTAKVSIILDGTIAAGSASLDAANGSITGGGMLSADSVNLTAVTGIYGATLNDSLSISATTISADDSGAFDVRLTNDNVLDTTVTSLTTVGGDLMFAQTNFGAVTFIGPVTSGDLSSAAPVAGGDITLTSANGLTVTASDQALSSESGTGGTLSVSGATINRAIDVGGGNITINGAGNDLIITGDITANASIDLSATGDVVVTSTITAVGAASDLTITADSDFDGVGGFWLKEGASSTGAQLNAGEDITIQGSSLLATAAGNDGIRIDGDGDTLQIIAGRDLTLSTIAGASSSNSGDIIIDGRQIADGSITVSSNSVAFVGADQTAGGDLLFESAVRLTNDLTLRAGGAVTFDGTLDDDGSSSTGSALTIVSGSDVLFGGAVGAIAGDRLDTLTVADAESVHFASTVTIDGDLDVTTTQATSSTAGAVTFDAAVTTTTGLATGSVEITNTGLLTINSGADFVLAGSFTQDGTSSTNLGANLTTINGSVLFDRAVLLTDSATIDSSIRNGDITFLGPVDSEGSAGNGEHNSLTLTSGAGTISFNGDLGAGSNGDQTLGNLTVLSAGTVLFGAADAGGDGTTGPVTEIATNGAIDIGVGTNVISGGIVLNAGSGILRIITTDDTVRFNGPVTLASAVDINTNATGTGGSVTFTSSATVDSQFGESNDLTIDVGTQQVLFNNDIGLAKSLGALTITQADGGVIFGQSDGNQGAGSTGPVTTIATDGAIDIGVGSNVVLGGIVLNAGSGTLNVTTADETVRFNGRVTLDSDVSINSNTAGFGGTVTFTSDATIDSQFGEHHDLTIDAGSQQVLFNNDLGARQSLGALTITQADGGVTFGESDSYQGPGKTGPVTTIVTDATIDIGVAEHVIPGGIVFNAGSGTLHIITTDDSARFNGPVTLATNVDIDTNNAGIGGTVTFTNAATIDSQSGEYNDLRIDAGAQQVQFNNGIGAVQALGALTITQADSGVTFGQPVTFGSSAIDQSPGTTGPVTTIATDGPIDIGVGSHVIGGDGIVLNAGSGMMSITTTDDTARFNGAVTLATDVRIDTNATGFGGTVTFTSAATIDSQSGEHNDLTIDAGTQQVLFNNDLGRTDSLGSFTITQADGGVIFGQADTDQGPGTIGPVTIIATNGSIDVGVAENVIAGAGIIFNAGSEMLQITTVDETVRLNGVVTMLSSVDINTNSTGDGGTVTFTSASTVDGQFGESNDLTIDAGTQQVLFNNDIGNINPIGALTITQADGGVIFGQDDTDQGPGTTGPVTTIITDGPIDIGVGSHVVTGGIVLNAGLNTLQMTTTDDSVRFNGPVTLDSALDINTNETPLTGGGSVTFTSAATIDSQVSEHNDLTIDAGSQQVLFNNDLGATQSLGALTITQADGGVIFGQSDSDLGPGTTGPVTKIFTDGSIDIGVGGNVVTGGIVLNAGTGSTDPLQVTTTDDSVRFNGPVTLATNVDINTNVNATSTGGGTVTFTSAATIDSETSEHNDLTIDAGSQQVLFNNNLGQTNSLGILTITQADSGVIFGQSDTDQGPGTTGPVTTITTDGAIDIGVGSNVITDGIVLNAGVMPVR
ncbi:MAG: hypothetical protein NT013_29570 [Planctomycetia bacterium]|nr:hypothetical protein [Planctomycetia bacterium]